MKNLTTKFPVPLLIHGVFIKGIEYEKQKFRS